LGKLVHECTSRIGGELSQIVDVGPGNGALIRALREEVPEANVAGVERGEPIPSADLAISNELFDAQPFARLVRRGNTLRELTVIERGGQLDWGERDADPRYAAYFAERGIELDEGQFADVSLDWAPLYEEICRAVPRGLVVTFDYGYAEEQLFRSRMRRYGTAAAYAGQRLSRDLLANPGKQDLTAHINFSDLIRAGERAGLTTLYFDRQAKFLLALGVTDHEHFKPLDEVGDGGLDLIDRRDEARRLVLPDGMGEEIRVLVQGRGVPADGWSFQRALW
jgi:SAM-dependent MidA family methyltransferase